MLTLEMLPADYGDCLWIEYGPERYKILIDGGTPGTYPALKRKIEALPPEERHFELFVISHIDSDHIGGCVKLLESPPEGISFGDVWFNGHRHLVEVDELGVRQAEELTASLVNGDYPWNTAYEGHAVLQHPEPFYLAGDLQLTVLSPGRPQLDKLRPVWQRELDKLRAKISEETPEEIEEDELGDDLDIDSLAGGTFREDRAEPNGSSIALLLEYEGRRILLAADSHPGVLAKSIEELLTLREEPVLEVDAFKLSHHGSRGNTSRRLIEMVSCPRYLISSSGKRFKHPSRETIARILKFASGNKELWFNYRSEFNEVWRNPALQSQYNYKPVFKSVLSL